MSASVAGRRRAPSILDPHSSVFGLFSDVLYVGVLVFAASLPLVTWFAAFSAGVQVLRVARDGDGRVRAREFARVFGQRLRRSPVLHVLVPSAVTALLAINVVVLPWTGMDPLYALVAPIVLAAALGAIALRIAGAWRSGLPARRVLATAWRRMSEDAAGSLLLAGAVTAAGAVVGIIPLLALVMPGPLALAAVAMDRERGAAE